LHVLYAGARTFYREWRAKQKDPGDLNHPSRVWTKYQHSAKARDERDAEKVKRRRSAAKETKGELAAARLSAGLRLWRRKNEAIICHPRFSTFCCRYANKRP